MTSLTAVQSRALRYVRDYIRDHGEGNVCPSYDELREALGLANKSSVHRLVHGLIERGHLRHMPGKWRSLELVEPLAEKTTSELKEMRRSINRILAGRVH